MSTCLIGYTGFVGSNILRRFPFDHLVNRQNLESLSGRNYSLLVCAGVSAVKWWANQNPEADWQGIQSLLEALDGVRAQSAFLISTVDVYPVLSGVDEDYDCHASPNHSYGTHRLLVEDYFREQFPSVHIVRLPALFGPGLKKNVIYDLMNDNCLDTINPESSFQYYPTQQLWSDMESIGREGLGLVNLFTEPVSTAEIHERMFPSKKIGRQPAPASRYDLRTKHAKTLGGSSQYRFSREEVLRHLSLYLESA